MKLQSLGVIFIIIIIPIILVVSYYMSLHIDTVNMQTSYNTKLLDATKEAIEAFEINTVEWNDAYSETADSKRRDIMASINTFTTSFANGIGVGGANKETILSYVPAIAYTLYDGYYIYSPAETKEVIKDSNGIAVFMSKELVNGNKEASLSGYAYKEDDEGKLLYVAESNAQGQYTLGEKTQSFTLEASDAKTTYSHVLKPFTAYSARYVNGDTDITVNYTLDNYITIYGKVKGEYQKKSGYLINTSNVTMPTNKKCEGIKLDSNEIKPETVTEKIAWRNDEKSDYKVDTYPYVYESENNTKVYFDGNKAFQVGSNGIRTNLENLSSVKYKKLSVYNEKYSCIEIYQALNNGIGTDGKEITAGTWYIEKNKGEGIPKDYGQSRIGLKQDVSAINYYTESYAFSKWVYDKLENITVDNMQNKTEEIITGGKIFENIEDEDSVFNSHKREVIKQVLTSNLNQAITSYSRNSEGEFQLPVLSETDWDQILNNVSIIAFVQNIPIGMKYYNNYAIATSTSNKEYVDPDEIYLSTSNDNYYHLPYCEHLTSTGGLIGYRSIDYRIRSYEKKDTSGKTTTKYYYKHDNISNEECYYCLVQRSLYNEEINDTKKTAYETALAREKYAARKIDVDIAKERPNVEIEITPFTNKGKITDTFNNTYVTSTNGQNVEYAYGKIKIKNDQDFGVYNYRYRINNGEWTNIETADNTTDILKLNGKYKIEVQVLDGEEIVASKDITIVIDNTGPEIEEIYRKTKPSSIPGINQWYIYVKVKDEFSEVNNLPEIKFSLIKDNMEKVEENIYEYGVSFIGDAIKGQITISDIFGNKTTGEYEFKSGSNNVAEITIINN